MHMAGTNSIEGKQLNLGDVFGQRYVFTIPEYQRPYLWGTDQCGELLADLLTALGDQDHIDISKLPEYFLGSVVLIQEEGGREHAVVDGQQRLSTLSILFAALRDALQDPKYQASAELCIVQEGDVARGVPDQPRLTLRRQDTKFFHGFVQVKGGTADLQGIAPTSGSESQRHLRENALYLHKQLSEMSEPRRQRLLSFMLRRTLLVVVTTGDCESAVRIFTVLNSRGLDLMVSDILKSELIAAAELDEQELSEFTQTWETIEQDLGRDSFQEFFAHVRMIQDRRRPKEEILKEFREKVLPKEKQARHPFVTSSLFRHAQTFQYVLARPKRYASNDPLADERIATSLHWLAYVDNIDWIPSAMFAFDRLEQQPALLAKALTAIERIAASLMIRRRDVNKRVARFAEVLDVIEKGLVGAVGTRLDLDPKERAEVLARLDGDLYNEHRNVVRLVLCRLDDLLANPAVPAASKMFCNSISVEHVLPQTVDFTANGAAQWGGWYTPQQHGAVLHRLGNLVLLSRNKNSSASNYDFVTKKAKYFTGPKGTSSFVLTTRVINESAWDIGAFQKHHDERLETLKEVWAL